MKTKSTLLISIFLLILSQIYAQPTLVADNRASAPTGLHIFGTLQAAIDSAFNYSAANSNATVTIHVIPSTTNYGTVTISSPIEMFGIGFNPDKDIALKSVLTTINLTQGSDNTRLSGLKVTSIVNIATSTGSAYSLTSLSFENCNIRQISSANDCCGARTIDNIIIRNCIVGVLTNSSSNVVYLDMIGNYGTATNTIITNCVISGYGNGNIGAVDGNGLLIKNCLFIGEGAGNDRRAFYDLYNSTINNNIFLGRSPTYSNAGHSNNTFNNNITFDTNDNTLPPTGSDGTNLGTGNLVATDPQLTLVAVADQYSFTYDLTPVVAGASENAGTDGTDIGPTGSTSGWDNTGVPLPLVQELNTNEVVKQGDNLSVNVKARGN